MYIPEREAEYVLKRSQIDFSSRDKEAEEIKEKDGWGAAGQQEKRQTVSEAKWV